MTFIPFAYDEVSQIIDIIGNNRMIIDQWLFSGIMNYTYALDRKLIKKDEGSFPPLHGSSFFGKLLEAQLQEGTIFNQISVDNITETEIEKVLSFYNLNSLKYYTVPFKSYDDLPNQVTFHQNLYAQKKTQLAITAIQSTYEKLKKAGVLVYRLTPSYLSIKLTIALLAERAQANHYENLQMAVIGFKVLNIAEIIGQNQLFKWKHHALRLKTSLLELTESIHGSFIEVGDGQYFIFTTKGEIDDNAESALFQLQDEYFIRDQISIGIAIGFGQSVLHAEQNVRDGLRKIDTSKHDAILIIEGQHQITERFPTGLGNHLDVETLEQALQTKFAGSAVNARDIMRISVYANKYGQQAFTAEDVSRWLQSSERNGRRILAELEQAHVIKKCGKAQSNLRGRPKNVYCFKHDTLLQPKKSETYKEKK